MRPRTIFLALVGVLLCNTLVVLGVWMWFRLTPTHDPLNALTVNESAGEGDARANIVETPPLETNVASTLRLAPPVAEASSVASFDTPQENQAVPRRFQASGRCAAVPAGQRLMLVVQTGRVFSPKMPPFLPEGEKWSGAVNEFGMPVGASFTLCLFQVSDTGVDEIAQWHAQGKATGKYPPYREVPGGVCLAKIKLRVGRGGNE